MKNVKSEVLPYQTRRLWILSIFLVVPSVLLVWAWDMFFNNQGLLPFLGLASLFLPLYLLVFEMPHIIASFVGFADKEYIKHYRAHLLYGMPLLLVGFLCLLWVDFTTAVAVYLAATMYHVIRQQTGIGLLFEVPRNNWFHGWSWSLVLSVAAAYVVTVLPRFVQDLEASQVTTFIMSTFALAIFCGGVLMTKTKSRVGVWYIVLTMVLFATSYVMMWFGYVFLAIFVGRFVHDITAFLFYITHEMNRNSGQIKNVLYTFVPLLPLSLIVVVPLFAILLGLFLRESISNTQILFTVIMLLAFMHYYLESVMWKRNAPHRQFIRVV